MQKERAPTGALSPYAVLGRGLDRRYVDCLRALVARLGVELDLCALGEGLESVASNSGVVYEQVLSAFIRSDEAEALVVVEPLNGSGCHVYWSSVFLSCCQRRKHVSTAAVQGEPSASGGVAPARMTK